MQRWNIPRKPAHFKEPGLHKKQLRRAASTLWKRVRHVGQAWLFILSCSHLKAARPRAAAHMSLHRQSQCQRAHRQEEADSCCSPLLLSGDICPYLLATEAARQFAAPRPVKRPLGPSLSRVNSNLIFYCEFLTRQPESRRNACICSVEAIDTPRNALPMSWC